MSVRTIRVSKIYEMLDSAKSIKHFKAMLDEQLNLANGSDELCFCRLHNRMEPKSMMVLGPDGKSKGVCKAASVIWQKRYRHIKKCKEHLSYRITNNEPTTDLVDLIRQLEAELNSVRSYDYDKDWAEYRLC